MSKHVLFEKWFSGDKYVINIINFKGVRTRNKKEYPNDPDVNTKRRWGIRTNGAKKGRPEDTCLDVQIDLGHLHLNFVNFDYNKKYRK